ncbi:MAG: hypothetical protein DMD34_05015 [Gemmatimonadetes bacterium]|nr:MAG: hypothetical protein DMD34_05015 [Gemmatimonadota bacterium]
MKRLGVMVGLALGLLNGTARSQENFAALLLKNSLSFTQPNEFSAVAVVDNPDVRYQFAMRSTVAKAEIRYAIFPSSNNDEVAAGFLQTICLNISNGKSCDIRPFPQPAVKAEFGADGGFTSVTALDSKFGKGFTYCMVNLIYKNGVADVAIFFMFDDVKVMPSLVTQERVFHALRFK